MKKSLLLFGFAATTMVASAQQTIYSADGAATFGTWTFTDVDVDGNNWAPIDRSSTQGLGGKGVSLVSYSINPSTFAALTPDNYATSTPINCSGYENLTLKFNRVAGGTPAASAENYSVYAVSAANPTALAAALATATPVFTETVVIGKELVGKTVNLSSLNGMNNVYIVFRHHNCTEQFFIAIDDVILEGTAIPASINDMNETKMSVYPQPMTNSLTISNEEEIASVVLIDQNGKTVLQKYDIAAKSILLNTENISEGVYILRVQTTSGAVLTQKCVK